MTLVEQAQHGAVEGSLVGESAGNIQIQNTPI
jgi:hypothetical protein